MHSFVINLYVVFSVIVIVHRRLLSSVCVQNTTGRVALYRGPTDCQYMTIGSHAFLKSDFSNKVLHHGIGS